MIQAIRKNVVIRYGGRVTVQFDCCSETAPHVYLQAYNLMPGSSLAFSKNR